MCQHGELTLFMIVGKGIKLTTVSSKSTSFFLKKKKKTPIVIGKKSYTLFHFKQSLS